MSIEHKAFVFDYNKFVKELAKLLESALRSQKTQKLIFFIEKNLQYLKDPYEGEPLDPSWKEMIEAKSIDEYGDFAITKYYNPQQDIGVGYNWELLNDALQNELEIEVSPLLGFPLGSDPNYFDPGKLGSYFQSPDLVRKNFEIINSLPLEKKQNLPNLFFLEEMLSTALALGKGLYITF